MFDKFKSYFIGGIAVILIAGGAWIGWHIKPTPKPIEHYTNNTDTLRLTQVERDSLDALWKAKFYIVKHGTTITIHQHDTSYAYSNDTSQFNGLYSIISQQAEQIAQMQSLYHGQQDVTDLAALTAAYKPTAHVWGVGIAAGAFSLIHAFTPSLAVGISIEHSANEFLPMATWAKDGWGIGMIYRRRFR